MSTTEKEGVIKAIRKPYGMDSEHPCEIKKGKFGGFLVTYLHKNGEPFLQTYYSFSSKNVKSHGYINADGNEKDGFTYSDYAPKNVGIFQNFYENGFLKETGKKIIEIKKAKKIKESIIGYKFYNQDGDLSVIGDFEVNHINILTANAKISSNFNKFYNQDICNGWDSKTLLEVYNDTDLLDLFDKNTEAAVAYQMKNCQNGTLAFKM